MRNALTTAGLALLFFALAGGSYSLGSAYSAQIIQASRHQAKLYPQPMGMVWDYIGPLPQAASSENLNIETGPNSL